MPDQNQTAMVKGTENLNDGLLVKGNVVSHKETAKGFIVSVLCIDKIQKFFTKKPSLFPLNKTISVAVTGPNDGFVGFSE